MTHNSPVNFKLIHFQLWTKESHESPNFETLSALMKICQIPHFIFQTTSQFFMKFTSLSSVMKDNSSVPYLA